MNNYKRVLIPVEDQQFVEAVIDFVTNHLWSPDTKFKVLHVNEPVVAAVAGMAGAPVIVMPQTSYQEQLEAGRHLVDNVVRKLDAGLNRRSEGFVESGMVKDVVIRYAKEWPADLIVMASHGRHGIERWLKGSVSSAISASAPCSICILYSKQESVAA